MSRCFPFPPPGYEKTRTVDADLLKKENHKEKKHKKKKKNKEKKEKKEKDRSEEKHTDKRDKRESEKKKDKEKDRDKDKDKKNVVGEKKFLVQNEGPNADKRIQKEHKRKDKNSISSEKFSGQYADYNGEKIRQSSHLVEESKIYKFIQEFDRRIKHDAGVGGTQMVHKFPVMGLKNDEATFKVVAKGNALPDDKEKVKGVDYRKSDGHGTLVDARPNGNAVVQNHVGSFQPRVEGLPKTLEKNSEKTQNGKEAIKEKKDEKRGEKHKDRDKEKRGHGKNKDRDKEKKKEKAKGQLEHKNLQNNKLKESNEADPFHPVSEENIKKRKDIESNGDLNANDNWPNKLWRSSSHPLSDGRKLEPSHTSVQSASDSWQRAAVDPKVDEKERKKNGTIEVSPFSVPSSKTVLGSTPPKQVYGFSVKSPHPDTKYLKQVYSVPHMETWSESDDQEWLFSSSSSQLSKQKVESSGTGDLTQVWAKALQIKQADFWALPYAIPY